jgi:hypothetical protein
LFLSTKRHDVAGTDPMEWCYYLAVIVWGIHHPCVSSHSFPKSADTILLAGADCEGDEALLLFLLLSC